MTDEKLEAVWNGMCWFMLLWGSFSIGAVIGRLYG